MGGRERLMCWRVMESAAAHMMSTMNAVVLSDHWTDADRERWGYLYEALRGYPSLTLTERERMSGRFDVGESADD